MTISVDPLTHTIHIPQSYLTLVSGTLYTMDTDQFRLDLKSWEDSEEGMPQLKTHDHNTEVTIAGVTYARSIKILAPYSITFENGQYSVRLEGSNNNIWDIGGGILNQNQVQVIPTNAAGLIVSGSGVTQQDKTDIANAVWAHTDGTAVKTKTGFIADVEGGRWKIVNNQMIFYKDDNITEVARFDLFDAAGSPTDDAVMERKRV